MKLLVRIKQKMEVTYFKGYSSQKCSQLHYRQEFNEELVEKIFLSLSIVLNLYYIQIATESVCRWTFQKKSGR